MESSLILEGNLHISHKSEASKLHVARYAPFQKPLPPPSSVAKRHYIVHSGVSAALVKTELIGTNEKFVQQHRDRACRKPTHSNGGRRVVPLLVKMTDASHANTTSTNNDPPATDSNNHDDMAKLSRLDPPSHILQDGRHVHLPSATASDRAAYFARSVARYGLVRADGGGGGGGGGGASGGKVKKRLPDGETAGDAEVRDDNKKTSDAQKSSDQTQPQIHPLALASASLNHVGISELSKSINLAGLIQDEGPSAYFGLTNVISSRAEREALRDAAGVAAVSGVEAAAASAGGVGLGDEVPAAASGAAPAVVAAAALSAPTQAEAEAEEDAAALDHHHRSLYTLSHHTAALSSSAAILRRHHHRLLLGNTAQSILDARYMELRKRWRLVAPEHGTKVKGAVRPDEVVAIDVEVYDRDRLGGGVVGSLGGGGGGSGGSGSGNKLGRIARRVPRFATVEVRDGYGLGQEATERLEEQTERDAKRRKMEEKEKDGDNEGEEKKNDDDGDDGDDAKDDEDVEMKDGKGVSVGDAEDTTTAKDGTADKTIAEPYAVADPTLGKVDLDFDPDQVPLLTLSMSIEKTQTGYVEEVILSSISNDDDDDDDDDVAADGKSKPDDEPVIYALQHSLFCASLFESMRGELSSAERAVPTNAGRGSSTSSSGGGLSKAAAGGACWLAGGTDESFLPAPTRMDGAPPAEGGLGGTICVVHCHQGEVKVRLNAEYDLTVKLVEAGTVRSTSKSSGHKRKKDTENKSDADTGSGSQSAAYLRTMCRALLLHAQSAYHDHRLRMHAKAMAVAAAEAAKAKSGLPPGLARRKKNAEEERPLILGGVLALGGKMLVERKVRESLRKLSRHISQQADMPHRHVVEWLTLSMFDAKSYFTASVGPAFTIDVCIDAGGMTVASFGESGQYKSVRYGTAEQFEMFMQLQIQRLSHGVGQ